MSEAVRVAVRCRPFNARERERNATLIISMAGNTTKITDPVSGKVKDYTFDYSYWSHDGFAEREDGYLEATAGSTYADQRAVMQDLGIGVLENAWTGFHSCVFAYGQTGSGKSYSIVGYGANKGIIPQICKTMFDRTAEQTSSDRRFEVEASMMEIYNEKMRDLLNPKMTDKLKIRETKQLGVYVESLTTTAVKSYAEIERQMEVGAAHRTIGATQMNATSSRAHTIFTITFKQFARNGDKWGETKSVINLVDLAGSERAESTGATGDRLKEGAAINSSLTALGQVITALAEQSGGKKTFVPFRNSVLTRLLQSALGGNSKTLMVAAISPADINYDETLSTLRYADNAKKIKTVAVKNEDPTARMIRELKEENDKLKALLAGKGDLSALSGGGMQAEQLEAAQAATAAAEEEARAAKQAMLAARAEVDDAQRKMAEFHAKMAMLEAESGWSDELSSLRNELASRDSLINRLKSAGDADAVVRAQDEHAAQVERLTTALAAAQAVAHSAGATFDAQQEALAVNRAALVVLDATATLPAAEQQRAVRDALAAALGRPASTIDARMVDDVLSRTATATAMSAMSDGAAEEMASLRAQIAQTAETSSMAAMSAEAALAQLVGQHAEIAQLQQREVAADEANAAADEAKISAAIERATLRVVEAMSSNAAAPTPTVEPIDEAALRARLVAELEDEHTAKSGTAVMQAALSRSVRTLMSAAAASRESDAAEQLERVRAQLKSSADAAWRACEGLAAAADKQQREAERQRAALEQRAAEIAALKAALADATAAKAAAHDALLQARIARSAMHVASRLESGEMDAGSAVGALRDALIDEISSAGAPVSLDALSTQAMIDANLSLLEAAAHKAKLAASSRAQVAAMRETLRSHVLGANEAARKAKDDADARVAELVATKEQADTRDAELESLRVELLAAKGSAAKGVALAFKGEQLRVEKERLKRKLVAEMEAAQAQVASAVSSEKSHASDARNAEAAVAAAAEAARLAQDELAATQALAQEQAKELKELQYKSAEEREKLLKELELKSAEAARAGDMSKKVDYVRQMKRISDRTKLEQEMKDKAREQLEANEKVMRELGRSFEDKLKETAELESSRKEMLARMGLHGLNEDGVDARTPHLVNLHEDPLMSGQLIHFLKPGRTVVGSEEGTCAIVLNGVSIEREHCAIHVDGGSVHIEPLGKGVTFVNGKRLEARRPLEHSSRVIIGQNAIFRFTDPVEAERQRAAGGGAQSAFKGVIDWDMAQQELGEALQSSVKLKVEEEVERERKAMETRLKEMEERLARERATQEAAALAEKEAILAQLREREKAMEAMREKQFDAEKSAVRNEARAQALEEERDRRAAHAPPSAGPYAGAIGTMGLGVQRMPVGAGGLGVQRPGMEGGPGARAPVDYDAELASIRMQQDAAIKHHESRIGAISISHSANLHDVDSARAAMEAGLAQYKLDMQRIEDEQRTAHPAVVEANAIADAMGRKVEVRTQIQIEAPEVMGLSPVQELLQVRRASLQYTYTVYGDSAAKKRVTIWPPDEFWRRVERFRDAHAFYLKHNRQPFESRDEDPFYTPPEPEVIGKAILFLKPLAHRVRLQTWAPILDSAGKTVGELQLALQPTELDFVTGVRPVLDPKGALGSTCAAIVRVQQARNLPANLCTNVFVRYSADGVEERTTPTATGKSATPRFDHRDNLAFGEVGTALINFLQKDALTFEVVAEPDDVEEGLVTEAPKSAASAAGANPYDGGELPPEVFDFNIAVDLLEGSAESGDAFERARFDGGSNALGLQSGIFTATHSRPRRILLQCMQGSKQSYPIKHVVSAWIGRVQNMHGDEVDPEQASARARARARAARGARQAGCAADRATLAARGSRARPPGTAASALAHDDAGRAHEQHRSQLVPRAVSLRSGELGA